MNLLRCAVYLVATGIIGFLLGRIIPQKWLKPDRALFHCFSFEQGGRIYEKLGIRRWQNRVPDMSKILPFMMPAKKLDHDFAGRLPEMIHETCVAETIHLLLCFSGLYCLKLWPGVGGFAVTVIYILFLNLPFILIQRYNRPRFIRLQQRLSIHTQKKKEKLCVH